MRYPESEPEQIALARAILSGLTQHTNIFPDPPIEIRAEQSQIDDYDSKRAAADSAAAQAQMAIAAKDAALEAVNLTSKAQINYAEHKTNYNDDELKLIGWGGRAAPTKLQPPSQPGMFEVLKQGEGWLFVDWKEPRQGGKAAAYIVRRSEDGLTFADAKTVTDSEGTLQNQPTGKKLWYHVVAVNHAGESEPSNTIVVSL